MDFRKYLKQTSLKLDREIQKILSKWLKEVEAIDEKLIPFAIAFKNACKGGRGIRGMLVMLGYELQMSNVKSQISNDIVKIGAAYEIFHTSILAHDDIMDKSLTRRGQPSLFKSVGISHAITLGDFGFFLAVKIISESNFEEKKKNQALNLFAKTMVDTAIGQILDIEKGDKMLTAKLKTAQYTISGPLKLGAILAGANEKLLANLGDFGHPLGIAFQIRDDILDKEMGQSLQQALKYIVRAKELIPKITTDSSMRKLLEEMAEYLVERSK